MKGARHTHEGLPTMTERMITDAELAEFSDTRLMESLTKHGMPE